MSNRPEPPTAVFLKATAPITLPCAVGPLFCGAMLMADIPLSMLSTIGLCAVTVIAAFAGVWISTR